jgi:hypothetical protein
MAATLNCNLMAATLKLQPYGSNFNTAILWLQLRNCNPMAGTLKLQSHGCNFKISILWLQL